MAAALVEKTFVTWVNRGDAKCFTQASNELAYTKAIFDSAGDRFMPPIKELWLQISGKDFPSADGLNNVTLPEIKDYTERIENVSTGVNMAAYGSYKFYTLFDFTGH